MSDLRAILITLALALVLTMSFLAALIVVPETVSAYTVRIPIYVEGDSGFTVANGVTGGSGTASDPYIIEGWEIDATTAHGIWIQDTTSHFIIRNCYVHHGGINWCGIYLAQCLNGAVTENECYYNIIGIFLEMSSSNTLTNNDCSYSDCGISLSSSSSNALSSNSCSPHNYCGIRLQSSDHNLLSDNDCRTCCYGIQLHSSFNNTLSDNNCCLDTLYGISLRDSGYNALNENNCSDNRYGIHLYKSTWTVVYYNIFFNNAEGHASDNDGSQNFWSVSYPIGGNYWDDYTGVDMYSGPNQDQPGPDGIGDTPYELDANVFDYYPLMEPPNTPPTASFVVSPSTGYVNTVFSVDASLSSDAEDDLSALEVRWDWESDGTWDTSWSVVKTDTHEYSTEGTHTITLEVRDTKGLVDNTTREITVVPDDIPPVADAGPNQMVTVGDEVTFDGSDSSDNVGIENYTWTFIYDEEERELYSVSPAFTFNISGTYIVTLIVEDAEGETDEDTVTITVEEEEQEEDEQGDGDDKSFLESYGLPLGIVAALAVIALILFFVLKGRKGGKAPVTLVEPPETEPVD